MAMHKKEDHRLLMTIQAGNLHVEGVRCKVYLPEKVTDPVQLEFFPTEEQRTRCFFFEGAIYGEIKGFSGETETSIQAERVYFPSAVTTHWGFEKETLLIGKPRDFKVTHWLGSRDAEHPSIIKGSFWLSPSIILAPHQTVQQSYTGNVNVETFKKERFTLGTGLSLDFSDHYRYSKNERGERISFPELVAEFEQEASMLDPERVPGFQHWKPWFHGFARNFSWQLFLMRISGRHSLKI